MMKLGSTCTRGALGAAAAVGLMAAGASGPSAQQSPELQDCADVVGTYLTKNFREGGDPEDFMARSLLSLTNGGHAFFTDSGEAGEPGYGPFSDGKGAWRCVSKVNGTSRISAVILDFTFVKMGEPGQQIGRLDIDAVFDADTGKLESKATLYFVPLAVNPMNDGALNKGQKFGLVGEKVSAP